MKPPDLNILVIDDNKSDRLVVKSILKNFLFTQVQEAEDSLSATKKISLSAQTGEAFNLLLIDWNMPGGNGIKVIKSVREELKMQSKEVKIIVMTATAERNVVEQAILGGADDFIVKPVEMNVLKAKIEKLFGGTD